MGSEPGSSKVSDFGGRDTHWYRLIQGWTGPCSKTHGWVAHPEDTRRGSGGRHLRCFLINQCALSALFFSGEALGAIGDPEVLEILKQYSTDPVVEVTQHPPCPPPSRVQELASDPVSCCHGDHLAQGCQERVAVRMDAGYCLFGQNWTLHF